MTLITPLSARRSRCVERNFIMLGNLPILASILPPLPSLKKSHYLRTKLEHCKELDTDDHWQRIRETTHAAALQAFGKKEPKSQDWFNANIGILQPPTEEKRDALQNYQRTPSPHYLEALHQARSRAEEECKNCNNNY